MSTSGWTIANKRENGLCATVPLCHWAWYIANPTYVYILASSSSLIMDSGMSMTTPSAPSSCSSSSPSSSSGCPCEPTRTPSLLPSDGHSVCAPLVPPSDGHSVCAPLVPPSDGHSVHLRCRLRMAAFRSGHAPAPVNWCAHLPCRLRMATFRSGHAPAPVNPCAHLPCRLRMAPAPLPVSLSGCICPPQMLDFSLAASGRRNVCLDILKHEVSRYVHDFVVCVCVLF